MCPIVEPRQGSRRSAEVHSPPRRHARSPPQRHRKAPTRRRGRRRARRAKTAKTVRHSPLATQLFRTARVEVEPYREAPPTPQASTGTREDDTLPLSEGAGDSARAAMSFRKEAVRSARVHLRAWAICSLEFNEDGNGFGAHRTDS